jgi:hypothetical protein
LGTVGAIGVMVAAAAGEPAFFPAASPAQAATNVSVDISFNVFYDRLADDGDWLSYHDRYVWVPRVDARWRPYVYGHWIYTRTYGWYWVSEEPFAWAVYHYGRWAFDPEIGWYWIPGRRWAPAWVAWSHTHDEIAWAPLPPDFDDDEIGVSISISSVPVYYWHVVPISFFLSVDLSDHIIHDRDHVRRVISTGEPETVIIQNNIVVNNFIDIDIIEKETKEKVVVYEEKPADNPEAAGKQMEGNAIAVFNPEVKDEKDAKPPKLKKADEVAKEKKASGTLPEEPAAETAAPAEGTEPATETQAEDQGTQKKKKKVEETVGTEQQQTGEEATEQPQVKTDEGQAAETEQPVKKKKKVEEAVGTNEPEVKTEEGQAIKTEQPVKKKKAVEEVQQPSTDEQQQVEEQPVKKKKKDAVQATEEQGTEKALEASPKEGASAADQEESAQKPAKKKKDTTEACNPQTEDCQEQ